MNIPRYLLKLCLSSLSRWAIRKHSIELIVVTGFYGTEIAREGIYQVLNENFRARRNTKQILWDMSIPLAVLGYKDKRRNAFQWIYLITKATFYLMFGHRNPHKLILNANCKFTQTAKFWASFLKPDYLVVLNYDQDSRIVDELLKRLKPNGVLIYDKDKVDESKLANVAYGQKFVYGKSAGAELVYDIQNSQIKYGKQTLKLPQAIPHLAYSALAAVFSVAIKQGIMIEEAGVDALKVDIGALLVQRIKQNFEKA